jgi:hypothetical protein
MENWPTDCRTITPRRSTGILPTSFHKKRRVDHKLSSTEKHLESLLQTASKSEVVQKRKEFVSKQNVQLRAYESVTSFKIFPLQVGARCS